MQRRVPPGPACSFFSSNSRTNLAALSVTCNLGKWTPLLFDRSSEGRPLKPGVGLSGDVQIFPTLSSRPEQIIAKR